MISQDKFRSHAKKKDLVLDTPLIIQILEFIHPHLYCIISPKLISYCGGQKESLPVSILLSLCSLATLESYFNTKQITISAQLYLKKFYETHDFVQTSEMYLEDEIPHIEMKRGN